MIDNKPFNNTQKSEAHKVASLMLIYSIWTLFYKHQFMYAKKLQPVTVS